MESPYPQLPSRNVLLAVIGFFFLAALLVYGQSLNNRFVRWDDGLLIYENAAVRSITPASLKSIFTTYDPELYIPLTLFSFQLDFAFGGPNPAVYHFHNLALHTLNAVLVLWLTMLLSRKRWIGLLCGVLFLVHPLNTEAVAWSSARKDVLSTMYFLISVISYMYAMRDGKRWQYGLSLAGYALGLLAKVTVIPLPLVLLLITWRERGRIGRRDIVRMLPFAAFGILFGIIAAFGKTAILSSVTPTQGIAMAAKSIVFYLEKLILPSHLSVLYPYNDDIILLSRNFLPYVLLCLGIGICVVMTLRWTKEIFFAGALFILTLAPSLPNFAKGGTYYIASDRYAYIPSIAFFLLIALGIDRIRSNGMIAPRILACVVAAGISALSVKAHAQSLTWNDTESLFRNVLKTYPDSHVAYNNMGNVERERGEVEKAIESYKKALTIQEGISRYDARTFAESSAKIMSNLGASYRAQGDFQTSLETYRKALVISPDYPQALVGLGVTYQQSGDAIQAESSFKKALQSPAPFPQANLNLGALYVHLKRYPEAIDQFDAAIAASPYFPQAYYNKGVALQKLTRNREALECYKKAVELEPRFVAARINLGILLAERKEFELSKDQFNAVLQYDPQNTRAKAALQQLATMHR